LAVFPIHLPPLRDRLEDLPELVQVMLQELAPSLSIHQPTIDADAIEAMKGYHWPGNVRELRNVVERAALLSQGHITRQVLPAEIVGGQASVAVPHIKDQSRPMTVTQAGPAPTRLIDQERALLLQALDAHDWNQSTAAKALGVSRDVLRYRMKKHALKRA